MWVSICLTTKKEKTKNKTLLPLVPELKSVGLIYKFVTMVD